VRASYVVRHGRRYGLLGAKGCVERDTIAALAALAALATADTADRAVSP
jgi:hypothetical protein